MALGRRGSFVGELGVSCSVKTQLSTWRRDRGHVNGDLKKAALSVALIKASLALLLVPELFLFVVFVFCLFVGFVFCLFLFVCGVCVLFVCGVWQPVSS